MLGNVITWLILPNSEPLSSPRLGYLVCGPVDEKPIDLFYFFIFWEAAWNHGMYREIWVQVALSLLSSKTSDDSAHQWYHGESIFQLARLRMSWWRSNEELWKDTVNYYGTLSTHLLPFFYKVFLKEVGMPDHLTCLLRNLYAGQEATVRNGHGTTDWFQIGKWVCQGCILSPCLFNLYAEYIIRNTGLQEAQAGIKIAGRNINNLQYAEDTTLMAESEEELKKPLDESERGNWKSWLKTQHSEN